jgi:riboflavin kinase/FMN adenylyltransferase
LPSNFSKLKVFQNITTFQTEKPTVLTIGTFDGVHIGHKKIIDRLTKTAQSEVLESVVLTFFPHPRMVLQQNSDIKLLNTIEEKQQLLAQIGLDILIIHPFDKTFSELSAEEFVKDILIDKLKIKKIIIGYDHRFGKNRSAGIEDLIILGKKYDFEVEQIPAQEIDEVSVSSTKIRKALEEGHVTLANSYLGYNYFFNATVIQGKQLGRTIGFPTANLKVSEDYKLIPEIGVYVVEGVVEGQNLKGMMNIGFKPTVDGKNLSVEVHFFDFNQDIYGKSIQVSVVEKIREEQKFASVEELKMQLEKDKIFALNYFQP